jgi:hypothetical protein
MKVKVKFLRSIIKEGKERKPGETLEIDATAAVNLAMKGVVVIPGYKVEKVKKEIEVNQLRKEEK